MGGNSSSLLLDVDVLAPHMVYNDTVVEETSLLLGDGESPDSPVQCSIHCTVGGGGVYVRETERFRAGGGGGDMPRATCQIK